MDINPYRFKSPWTDYEFAKHVLVNHSSTVIMSMAWSEAESPDPSISISIPESSPNLRMLKYWVERLKPIIDSNREDDVVIAICNRCGREGSVVYAGSSMVMNIKNGHVKIYDALTHNEEGFLVVDTANTALARWSVAL